MTIEERIEATLFGYVAGLQFDGAPPVAWPNVEFAPPAGAYISVQHLPNNNTRLLLKGSAPHMRQGILQLTAVMPLNGGTTPGTALAGDIAEQFPADLALFDDDLKVRIQAVPDVAAAERTDVSWDVRLSIYYEAFA